MLQKVAEFHNSLLSVLNRLLSVLNSFQSVINNLMWAFNSLLSVLDGSSALNRLLNSLPTIC